MYSKLAADDVKLSQLTSITFWRDASPGMPARRCKLNGSRIFGALLKFVVRFASDLCFSFVMQKYRLHLCVAQFSLRSHDKNSPASSFTCSPQKGGVSRRHGCWRQNIDKFTGIFLQLSIRCSSIE